MSYKSLIGKTAPPISLLNYDGETFTFAPEGLSKPTVLFFYPESGSYGCTKEACQFRDAIAQKDTFKPGSVQIIGISPDPVEKQKKFVEKEKLTYPVLSDTKKEAFSAYGIGRGILGLLPVARVTFIVDKKGVVRDALDATVNYAAHSKFVEKWLALLEKEEKENPKGDESAPTTEEPITTTTAPTTTTVAETVPINPEATASTTATAEAPVAGAMLQDK